MLTCEHCREQLLEHAYGLVEGAELEETLAHLDACAECRSALLEAQGDKNLMARAARAIPQVPEFVLPGEDAARTAEVAQTAVQPIAPPAADGARPKQSAWRRHWISWVLAASISLAFAAPVMWYRATVSRYQIELSAAREQVKDSDLKLAALPAKFERLHDEKIKEIRDHADPYLHVVGPKTLTPNARGHLHITTRHPEGDLAACDVLVKLVQADTGKVIHFRHHKSLGHADADFDAAGARPNSNLTLTVEAEAAHGISRLHETLHVQAPAYVTRIDANKAIYQVNDVLFFRVLVLDRTTLQPPAADIPLRVSLVHDNKPVRSIERQTGPGGILAAEFAVQEKFPEGAYTLEVHPVNAGKTNVQMASLALEIVRALPDIRLDQDRYLPGAMVTGEMLFRDGQAVPKQVNGTFGANGQSVPVTLQPQAAGPAFGGGGVSGSLGAKATKGRMNTAAPPSARFSAPIPAAVPAGVNHLQMTLEWEEGSKKQERRTLIPLAPTEFAIDFFPEGGDLIAGVPNRVFYRVRSKTGEPVSGDGRVILLSNKNDILDTHYQLGMGHFDFTPDPKETYTVRITTPMKVENVAEPFKRLGGIRSEGVVLHIPRAVGRQDDPICVTLRQQGPPRKLLLVAHCRGQIVDQRWVEIALGSTHVALQPTPEACGMIRVTAFETVGNALEPVAERLVYRAPAQSLQLAFTPNLQQYHPGSTTTAKIDAQDETGQPTPAWILASVVDERFQAPPRSLSSHFLLMNEVRSGPDLENAQIILNDSPASNQVLERFLGTHGWRRYVPIRESAPPAGNDAPASPALVFSKENMPAARLQKNYQTKFAGVLGPINAQADEERNQLGEERTRRASAFNLLADDLRRFEEQVQLMIRLGLGLAVAVLLSAGFALMGVGVYRVIRANKAATPSFGSAFVCLATCLAIVFVGDFLGPIQDGRIPGNALPAAKAPHKLQQFAQGPEFKEIPEKITTGAYGLRRLANVAERKLAQPAAAQHPEESAKAVSPQMLQGQQMVMNLAVRERTEALNLRQPARSDKNMQDRFRDAIADAVAGKESQAGKPVTPAPGVAGDGTNGSRRIEYAYRFEDGRTSDTLLWHPTLLLTNGAGVVHFDIPQAPATYRVILLGHTSTGRFGFFGTRLDVPAFQGR